MVGVDYGFLALDLTQKWEMDNDSSVAGRSKRDTAAQRVSERTITGGRFAGQRNLEGRRRFPISAPGAQILYHTRPKSTSYSRFKKQKSLPANYFEKQTIWSAPGITDGLPVNIESLEDGCLTHFLVFREYPQVPSNRTFVFESRSGDTCEEIKFSIWFQR
jgi:hypothetical protein